jgi:hypothetical protein
MTLVDPFIPTRTRKPLATPRRQNPRHKAAAIRPPVPADAQRSTQPSIPAQSPAAMPVKITFVAPPKKISRLKSALQLTALVVWALALGLGTYLQPVGEAAILSYAVAALVFKFSSRTTFALAVTAFFAVVVLQLVKPDSEMLSNFIVYAFLLLIFGSVTAGLEVRRAKRWSLKRSPQRTKLQR